MGDRPVDAVPDPVDHDGHTVALDRPATEVSDPVPIPDDWLTGPLLGDGPFGEDGELVAVNGHVTAERFFELMRDLGDLVCWFDPDVWDGWPDEGLRRCWAVRTPWRHPSYGHDWVFLVTDPVPGAVPVTAVNVEWGPDWAPSPMPTTAPWVENGGTDGR